MSRDMLVGLLQSTLLQAEPFDPGFPEWFVFFLSVAIIVLSYVIRYRFSSRKAHQYIQHVNPGELKDAIHAPDRPEP